MRLSWFCGLGGLMLAAGAARAQMDSMPMHMDMKHMTMTPLRPAQPGDSARAAAILAAAKEAMVPYTDYHKALDDGFHIFARDVPQHVYHFTSWRRAFRAHWHFDPTKPTALLYQKTGDSTYKLVGVMYTAPASATPEELNARVPLSMAQWHLHTNWCLAKRGDKKRLLAISDKDACEAAGGRFLPHVFGWMVHVGPTGFGAEATKGD
jgi:hypothetical protein